MIGLRSDWLFIGSLERERRGEDVRERERGVVGLIMEERKIHEKLWGVT